MRDAIRLRYSLSPYIYTSAREAFDTGNSICRPLYYDHPEVPEALWTYDGANLTMKIYLPESDISECLTVDCRFHEVFINLSQSYLYIFATFLSLTLR